MIRLILIMAITALLGVFSYFVFQAGVDSCRAETAANQEKERAKDVKKVEKVIQYKEKIKVVYRDRIKSIKATQDTTGCADVKLTDMGFSLLPGPNSD